MGMFDYIRCEVPLPLNKKITKAFGEKDWTKVHFQTKDLDNALFNFVIKKNKNLIHEIRKDKWVEKKKKTGIKAFLNSLNKNKRWEHPYEIIEGKTVHKKYKYTGVINFYSLECDTNGDTWDLEFSAKIIDSKLASIKFLKSSIWETREEREKKDKEITEMMNKSYNCPLNKIRRFLNKITFGYWRWTWSKIATFISRSGNKIAYAIHRYV